MKPVSCKQELGDTERICTLEPHRALLNFQFKKLDDIGYGHSLLQLGTVPQFGEQALT